jgi:iron complex transport system permease protein
VSVSALPHRDDTRAPAVRHFSAVLGIGLFMLAALVVLHIIVGTVEVTPSEVLAALLNRAEDVLHRQVVWGLRLPRALVGVLAGAMLGLAGAILQTVTRNPLADPSLLACRRAGYWRSLSALSCCRTGPPRPA